MKTYKKVEVEAVNAPSGSYAAGCPVETEGPGAEYWCKKCQLSK